jgi:hypothetical protein
MLKRIGAIALNTWRETMRDRLLNAAMIAVLAIAGLALFMEGRQGGVAALDLALTAMNGTGLLMAVFLGTSLVHKELDRRTLFVVLTKPVSRMEFLLGKFVGLMGTLTVMMALMGLGVGAVMLAIGHPDPKVLGVLAANWMQLGLVTSMAFCFSTITSGPLAALYTVGFYVLGQQTLMVREFADSEAKLHLYNYVLGRALYYVLPNFGAFDFKNNVLYGQHLAWASWGFVMAYGLALSLALLLAASLAWESRELP